MAVAALAAALFASTGAADAKVTLPAASLGQAGPAQSVTIGYLGLENDPRHAPFNANTEIELAPADDPTLGVRMGLSDEK
ncbi:MAG TPA: hypothetical protein VFO41_10940, partial [Alphaproteobacteria bacterium]|nr:hypothetical protein [Alphaproteobacteria bacterium]